MSNSEISLSHETTFWDSVRCPANIVFVSERVVIFLIKWYRFVWCFGVGKIWSGSQIGVVINNGSANFAYRVRWLLLSPPNYNLLVVLAVVLDAASQDDAEYQKWHEFGKRIKRCLKHQVVFRSVLRGPPKVIARPNPKEAQDQTHLDQSWDTNNLAAHAIFKSLVIAH